MAEKPTQGKPIAALRAFARRLGWPALRCHQHVWEDGNLLVTWYESGKTDGSRNDLFLQINECPIGQTATYTAAVFAIRYRICTGWHSMRLERDGNGHLREADRLEPWLHRRWFESLLNRREFRRLHPECSGWSWKRVREERLPYEVVDAENCVTARTR
jgi:hypothetical protein